MKIKIENEETLFDVLANQKEKYPQLKDIEFCDNFLNSIAISLKIEGKIPTGEPIQGHITTDLLNICNAWQNAIYSIYANVMKNKDDARGNNLSKSEREKLSLIFKIKEGSTEQNIENIGKIFNLLKDMDTIKLAMLVGGIILIAGFYVGYKVIESNNDKQKFLAQNKTIDKAMNDIKEITIAALNSNRLQIETATIGNKIITKEQIQEMYDEMQSEENILQETETKKFIVKKLYKNRFKKMATLSTNDIDIEVSFANNLFEENETIFLNSFSKEQPIECEVLIEKLPNRTIKKATLLKINPQPPQ